MWKPVLGRMARNLSSDQITLAAAGCAFYATLSLFPAISTLISIYGLVFDPDTVEPQLDLLRHLLPPAAFTLIGERIHTLVAEPHSSLTLNLIISTTIALWSTSAATRSIISAVNIAYDTRETRGFLRFQLMAMGMTLCAICGAVLTLGVLVALPVLIRFLPERLGIAPPPWSVGLLVQAGGPALMLLFVLAACSLLYRFSPNREITRWVCILPGSCAATLIWIVSSIGFSYYVSAIASYNATYGPLGAVVATMMWFFVTAFVILLGAELNAGLEAEMNLRPYQGEHDAGQRGAPVAP
jgi:membrane protein